MSGVDYLSNYVVLEVGYTTNLQKILFAAENVDVFRVEES